MSLAGKKIILSITGSIAAYKTPELVRQLIKAGAEVRVIMTKNAADFVSPLSLATVSKQEVVSDVHNGAQWNNHVALGLWADAMLVAPCSANTLAKLAHGICDNMVNAVYLSARCPVFIAPAMDEDMWHHPATQTNLKELSQNGAIIFPVGHGELASGLIGQGRMMEPEQMVGYLTTYFAKQQRLLGKRALVTAGPTYERIDPVRFIGNFSSGKMGIAIADSLADNGAEVKLVLGPSHHLPKNKNVEVIRVESAEEMYQACGAHFEQSDITVMSAAVADYKPTNKANEKIKKKEESLLIELTKNKDILATLGSKKKDGQLLVGFALETQNALAYAQEKLKKKNADMIVMNTLQDPGAGFALDTNKVTLVRPDSAPEALPLMSKQEVAHAIVEKICTILYDEKTLV